MIIFSWVSYNPTGEILNCLKFLNVCGRCICPDRGAIVEFTHYYGTDDCAEGVTVKVLTSTM